MQDTGRSASESLTFITQRNPEALFVQHQSEGSGKGYNENAQNQSGYAHFSKIGRRPFGEHPEHRRQLVRPESIEKPLDDEGQAYGRYEVGPVDAHGPDTYRSRGSVSTVDASFSALPYKD